MDFFKKKSKKHIEERRVIVLVGGSGYVGSALIEACSEWEDVLFVVVSRSGDYTGGNSIAVRGDVTHDVENIISRIMGITGKIDVVVYLAATYAFETAQSLSREAMLKEFDVNTVAPLLFVQEVYAVCWSVFSPIENNQKSHKVIVVGSKAGDGRTAREELITYSATKAALEAAWKYYDPYLKNKGIESNFLKPGNLQDKNDLDLFIKTLKSSID